MSRQAELTPGRTGRRSSSGAIQVAAGILCDTEGRVLITERVGGGPWNGLWEFPGGKLHAGETAAAALERELREEIGIEAVVRDTFLRIAHDYADRSVSIDFFLIREWLNEPAGLEGQRLEWVRPAGLDASRLLPANAPVLDALKRI